MDMRDKVIKVLSNYKNHAFGDKDEKVTVKEIIALLRALYAFKVYFDSLYGEGLEIANFHQNGAMEPFDNFYDSAMEEYENAKCADTQRDYQAAVEMTEYCERYESTYNSEDGSM